MEPKLPAPERAPERVSPSVKSLETTFAAQNLERRENVTPERGLEPQPVTAPQSVLPPLPPAANDAPVAPSAPADDTPLIANDDDLIEKEWVDKAKQILATTKDDPYRREREVSKLQIEYLRKRYGKELAQSD
jgi:hypothetical protein